MAVQLLPPAPSNPQACPKDETVSQTKSHSTLLPCFSAVALLTGAWITGQTWNTLRLLGCVLSAHGPSWVIKMHSRGLGLVLILFGLLGVGLVFPVGWTLSGTRKDTRHGGIYEESTHFIHRAVSTTEMQRSGWCCRRQERGAGQSPKHGHTGPPAASADSHAVLGVQMDSHALSRGTQHTLYTAVLPQF